MFTSKPPSIQTAFAFGSVFISVLAMLGHSTVTSAQTLQARPIARLISGPTGISRPRKVTPEAETERDLPAASSATWAKASAVERRAFELTNTARTQNGLEPLSWDEALCRMARAYSEQMATVGFFAHETPEGLQLKDRAHANGVHFRVIGENIAYNKGYDDPGGFAVERWLISPGHRANILYTAFNASAIGSYVAADGSVYLTQVFIAR